MRTVPAPRSRAAAATLANSRSCSSRLSSARRCSRSSVKNWSPGAPDRSSARDGSGDDMRLPPHQHALDLEVVIQDDEVSWKIKAKPAERGHLEHPCRYSSGSTDGLGQRDAEGVEVPYRVDHRQHAPGEHAVRPANGAVAHHDLEAADAVGAVADAGAGHRVG